MKHALMNRYLCLTFTLVLSAWSDGCSTMDQSLALGGGIGTVAGATATFGGYFAGESRTPSVGTIAIGAGIGMAVGLVTAYFTHKSVTDDRNSCEADHIEMHFGDLPPSPFIVPKPETKKGVK
jgi:hypothetical protein